MNPELIGVEYSHELESYIAVFSNEEFVLLEADNLPEARREAERFVDHG